MATALGPRQDARPETPTVDMERPIVVVGSHVPGLVIEVDALPLEGETVIGHDFSEPEDGGKATNQAVAAAKLGAPVRVVTLLGSDERGRRWRKLLEGHGLDTRFVLDADGPTDVGFVLLPPSRIPAIVSSVDLSLSLDADAVEMARPAFDGASFVLCQLEAPQSCAIASFAAGRAVGAGTILNAAPAQALDPALVELTDIIVANEHEAAILAGCSRPIEDLALELNRQAPGATILATAGHKGCFVCTNGELHHVPAPAAKVVDTTGAGDAFAGAFAARLRSGCALLPAVSYAVYAASLSVEHYGSIPSFPTADILETALAHATDGASRTEE